MRRCGLMAGDHPPNSFGMGAILTNKWALRRSMLAPLPTRPRQFR